MNFFLFSLIVTFTLFLQIQAQILQISNDKPRLTATTKKNPKGRKNIVFTESMSGISSTISRAWKLVNQECAEDGNIEAALWKFSLLLDSQTSGSDKKLVFENLKNIMNGFEKERLKFQKLKAKKS